MWGLFHKGVLQRQWYEDKQGAVNLARELKVITVDPLQDYNAPDTLKLTKLLDGYGFRSDDKVRAGAKAKVRKEWGCRCAYCGIQLSCSKGTVDHILPLSKGGTSAFENLAYACKPCNQAKAGDLPRGGSSSIWVPRKWTD